MLILKAFRANSGCYPLDTTARWVKPRRTTQIRHVNFNNNTTEINQSLSGMRAQRGRCSGPRLGHADRCTPPQRKRNRLVYCFTSATAAFSSVSLQRLSCQQLPDRITHRQRQGLLCMNVCHRCSMWSRNKYVDLVQQICPHPFHCPKQSTDQHISSTKITIHMIKFHRHFRQCLRITLGRYATGSSCYVSTKLHGITTRQTLILILTAEENLKSQMPPIIVLGAFAKLRKPAISCVMSVRPHWKKNSAPAGRFFIKFDITTLFLKICRENWSSIKICQNNGYCTWIRMHTW